MTYKIRKPPMRFHLTLDQRIDQTIKILKAKRNKPKTQVVRVEELDLWNTK